MKAKITKILLLVAGIAGILQGVMTLVGGVVAAEDTCPDDIPMSFANSKYACGFMRVKASGSCSFDRADRGWFKRVYKAIQDDVNTAGKAVDMDAVKKLAAYGAVLSYGIILGIGWIAAGALALVVYLKGGNKLALVAGIIFAVLYALFIALFGAIWDSQLKIEDDCKPIFDNNCSDLKGLLLRSSREFLGYSICAFILILYCIIACFLFALASEAPTEDASKGEVRGTEQSNIALAPGKSSSTGAGPQGAGPGTQIPVGIPDVIAVTPNQPAAQHTTDQFAQVNKYLADDARLNKKVDKKFAAIDKDNSGSVVASELEAFVTGLMAKKNLGAPKPEAIAAIVRKYDKDKTNKLEKGEFRAFLHDVYMMCRENLVRKYAKQKAEQLKGTKPPVTDISGAQQLEELLKSTSKFYDELTVVAKEVDKDKSNTLSLAEVTDLCSRFCTKYKVPTMTGEEIIVVMKDMDRPVGEYNIKDLRLAALAILSIAKNIAFPS